MTLLWCLACASSTQPHLGQGSICSRNRINYSADDFCQVSRISSALNLISEELAYVRDCEISLFPSFTLYTILSEFVKIFMTSKFASMFNDGASERTHEQRVRSALSSPAIDACFSAALGPPPSSATASHLAPPRGPPEKFVAVS